MPRDGSGVSSPPPGTGGTASTTILSSMFNAWVADVTATFNTAWPVSLGGTGTTDLAFPDGTIRIKNTTDGTKKVAFDLSGQTTALTRTQKTPNYNGTLSSQALGTAIASATTTAIGAASGSIVHVTGTTTITGFGTADAGIEKTVVFDGALTLTYNGTSLILPGAANILTAAGDIAAFVSEGSGNWRCVKYQRASVPANALIPFASASPAAAASVLFSGLPSAVKSWRLEVINARPATDSDNLAVRMSASGTPVATNYQSGLLRTDYDSAAPSNTNTTTYIAIGATVGNAANEGISCSAVIQNMGQSGYTFVHGTGSAINAAGSVRMVTFAGALLSATAYTEISISFAGGNIASGEIRLYAEWD